MWVHYIDWRFLSQVIVGLLRDRMRRIYLQILEHFFFLLCCVLRETIEKGSVKKARAALRTMVTLTHSVFLFDRAMKSSSSLLSLEVFGKGVLKNS